MDEQDVISELKSKGLATFGTKIDRLNRLKKHYGISKSGNGSNKDKVVNKIQLIKQKREDRRAELTKLRKEKAKKEAANLALGKFGDVEFLQMIKRKQYKEKLLYPHKSSRNLKLCVCVRKRPIFKKEEEAGQNDSISCANPNIKVFESKLKVDGITKYLDEHVFTFDNTFNEHESTEDVYKFALEPSLDMLFNQGMVTIFAYGQTSSGKTFTMQGIQENSVRQLFELKEELAPESNLKVAFYEIYGGSCFDLLNDKAKVQILEDRNNNVVINGLVEEEVRSEFELLERINFAFEKRTTHSTVANDTSSRSHAICKITIRDDLGYVLGVLIVCDLAGSERAQDTKSNSRQRRIEGAGINKSLLALKECIRAMGSGGGHIPFRASKLTLSLRDSFKSKKYNNKVIIIACVCPGSSSADHTLNTLRYADRLKSKKTIMKQYGKNPRNQSRDRSKTNPTYGTKNSNVNNSKSRSKNDSFHKKAEKFPSNGTRLRNLNNGNPKKLHNRLKKGPTSRRKVSIGKKKKNERPPRNLPQASKMTPNFEIYSNHKGEIRKYSDEPVKKHPQPNRPPPLPQNLQELSDQKRREKEDLDFMKNTLKNESEAQDEPDDYFDFQEKVEYILDLQEDIMNLHLSAIREDAQMLKKESEIINNARSNDADYEIDNYINDTEDIVRKKLMLNKQISDKIKLAKKALAEEEAYSKKMKNFMYY